MNEQYDRQRDGHIDIHRHRQSDRKNRQLVRKIGIHRHRQSDRKNRQTNISVDQ